MMYCDTGATMHSKALSQRKTVGIFMCDGDLTVNHGEWTLIMPFSATALFEHKPSSCTAVSKLCNNMIIVIVVYSHLLI